MLKINCFLFFSSVFIVPFTLIRGTPIYPELEGEPDPFSLNYLLNEINQTGLELAKTLSNNTEDSENSADTLKGGKKPYGKPYPFVKPKPNFVLPLIVPRCSPGPVSNWTKEQFTSICVSPDPYIMSGDRTNQPAQLIAMGLRCYINLLSCYLIGPVTPVAPVAPVPPALPKPPKPTHPGGHSAPLIKV